MPVDKRRGLAEFNIPEPEYDELLAEFVGQAEEKIKAIRHTVASGDAAGAGEIAHSLKGVAGNMRLDICFNLARGIEIMLKKGETGRLEQRVTDFLRAVAEVRDSINVKQVPPTL